MSYHEMELTHSERQWLLGLNGDGNVTNVKKSFVIDVSGPAQHGKTSFIESMLLVMDVDYEFRKAEGNEHRLLVRSR